MKDSLRNLWIKSAALVPLLLLSASSLNGQTTNSNNLTVLGYLDVTNDISFGTLTNGTPAGYLQYNNSDIEFTAAQTSSVILWQDGGTNTPSNKLRLDGSNNLVVFGTNGSAAITFSPNTGGGISLANSGSGIVFSDGTVLSSAYGLNGSGGSAAVAYNSSGGLAAAGDTAATYGSLALGFSSWATGIYSTAIGTESSAGGAFSMALGEQANASGNSSTALGSQTTASGTDSTAFGQSTTASGQDSTAFGSANWASGTSSTAFGQFDIASGNYSTVFGYDNSAPGTYSTVFGYLNNAGGLGDFVFGTSSSATNTAATAFGQYGYASGADATAFGFSSAASGSNATAFGFASSASGNEAIAFGIGSKARSYGSVAFGQYNVGVTNSSASTNTWITNDPILEIGNGVSGAPSNAVTIFKNGNVRTVGNFETMGSVRMPQAGDMSMGSFTNGNSPTNLSAANGLTYPGGN